MKSNLENLEILNILFLLFECALWNSRLAKIRPQPLDCRMVHILMPPSMLYVLASSLYAASILYVNFTSIHRLYALCSTFSIASMLYAQCSMLYALCIEVKLPNGFKPYKYLAHHFNQVHKKSFTCDTCSKQFGSKYLLSIGGVWFDLHRWFDLHIFQHTRIQHANNSTYHNSTYK